jgi:hypothetical protein
MLLVLVDFPIASPSMCAHAIAPFAFVFAVAVVELTLSPSEWPVCAPIAFSLLCVGDSR